jgi:retron-type reverse transcriptase
MIPDCLKQFSVPNKLINLVKLTLQDTKVKVKINNNYTEQSEVRTGVTQGDPLSPVLFSTVMDVIIRKLEIRGNILTRLKQLSAYADDVLIMARTKQTLINTLKLKNEALKYGLIVNENRTKYLNVLGNKPKLEN